MTIDEMDREVEEARQAILDHTNDRWAVLAPRLDALIAAVEKRERARLHTFATHDEFQEYLRARTSEEAGG